MDETDFVGTWRLVSFESRSSDGTVSYLLGSDACGFIMYAADGYVSVVLSSAHRPRFGTPDIFVSSQEQRAAATQTYISYAGRYDVRGEWVRHYVEASLFPDWVGSTQDRRYNFEGSRLTLSTDPIPLGGKLRTSVLVWERVTASG